MSSISDICVYLDNISDKVIEQATVKCTDKGVHEALLLHKLSSLQLPYQADYKKYIGNLRVDVDKVNNLIKEFGCERVSDKPCDSMYRYVRLSPP